MRCFNFSRKKTKSNKMTTEIINSVETMSPSISRFAEIQQHGCEFSASNLRADNNSNEIDYNQFELYERTGFVGTNDYRKPIVTGFDRTTPRNFLGQIKNRIIHQSPYRFDDPHFLKHISSIVENTNSLLFKSLKSRLMASNNDLDELNGLIKWLRLEVFNIRTIRTHNCSRFNPA